MDVMGIWRGAVTVLGTVSWMVDWHATDVLLLGLHNTATYWRAQMVTATITTEAQRAWYPDERVHCIYISCILHSGSMLLLCMRCNSVTCTWAGTTTATSHLLGCILLPALLTNAADILRDIL